MPTSRRQWSRGNGTSFTSRQAVQGSPGGHQQSATVAARSLCYGGPAALVTARLALLSAITAGFLPPVQAAYFEQKFHSTFYLAPEELERDSDKPQSSSRRPEPISRTSMPRQRSRSPPGGTTLAASGRDAAAAAAPAQPPLQAEGPEQGRQSSRGQHPAAAAAGDQSGAAGRLPVVGMQHGLGTDGHAAPLEDPSLQHLYYGEQAVPAAQHSMDLEPQPSLSPRCEAASQERMRLCLRGMCPC